MLLLFYCNFVLIVWIDILNWQFVTKILIILVNAQEVERRGQPTCSSDVSNLYNSIKIIIFNEYSTKVNLSKLYLWNGRCKYILYCLQLQQTRLQWSIPACCRKRLQYFSFFSYPWYLCQMNLFHFLVVCDFYGNSRFWHSRMELWLWRSCRGWPTTTYRKELDRVKSCNIIFYIKPVEVCPRKIG